VAPAAETLGKFLASYIKGRTVVKESTRIVYSHMQRCLVEFFEPKGVTRSLESITPVDADRWRDWLSSDEELSRNTIARRCGIARQFFRAAVRGKLIAENPFHGMKGLDVKGNAERFYFVTPAETEKVRAACPDDEWKLIFALSRIGGLRCPS
jgi:site-specific recombinase XerD